MPASVNSISACPCQRSCTFHSDCPWRITSRWAMTSFADTRTQGSRKRYDEYVVQLRMFASAREAAGTARDTMPGDTVDQVLAGAVARFGADFATVLQSCRVWVNGESADGTSAVTDTDEVAILPPVSGGDK
ncbi:MAG: hypothetical protein F2732_04570 [Actinobacteria bacterium]|nr:hypothetical protein [Actinomycetota bacterium]